MLEPTLQTIGPDGNLVPIDMNNSPWLADIAKTPDVSFNNSMEEGMVHEKLAQYRLVSNYNLKIKLKDWPVEANPLKSGSPDLLVSIFNGTWSDDDQLYFDLFIMFLSHGILSTDRSHVELEDQSWRDKLEGFLDKYVDFLAGMVMSVTASDQNVIDRLFPIIRNSYHNIYQTIRPAE